MQESFLTWKIISREAVKIDKEYGFDSKRGIGNKRHSTSPSKSVRSSKLSTNNIRISKTCAGVSMMLSDVTSLHTLPSDVSVEVNQVQS